MALFRSLIVGGCREMSFPLAGLFFSRTQTINEASALPFGKKTMEMTLYACSLAFMCTSGPTESRLESYPFSHFSKVR